MDKRISRAFALATHRQPCKRPNFKARATSCGLPTAEIILRRFLAVTAYLANVVSYEFISATSLYHRALVATPSHMPSYIICYDIAHPRRLGQIHRELKKHAVPVQYSVFLFTGTPTKLEQCLTRLEHLMNPHKDDIRVYPLPERGLRWSLGPSALPEGIIMGDMPDPNQHLVPANRKNDTNKIQDTEKPLFFTDISQNKAKKP